MDSKNIALVRATNIIPMDGKVRPLSKVPYIRKERGTQFAFAMSDLLKKLGIVTPLNPQDYFTKSEEEQEEILQENRKITEEYLPYNSDYNSVVLWSLNGLVPDDINNTFSNKSCAIIESLDEQKDKTEIVSIIPTDTALKGEVTLSNRATILISKERYESLTDAEKEQLASLDLNVKIFEGDLQESVDKVLESDPDFASEELSLNRATNGYRDSETKDELLEAINDFAEERNIPQVLFFNLITGQNDDLDRLESVKDEYKNSALVSDCYRKTFLNYLCSKLEISKETATSAITYMDSEVYMKKLCEEIETIGIDKYKEVVDKYNQSIEKLKEEGMLPTPEEIVENISENKDYTLNSLIDEIENKKEDPMLEGIKKIDQEVSAEDRKECIEKLKEEINKSNNIEKTANQKGDDPRV